MTVIELKAAVERFREDSYADHGHCRSDDGCMIADALTDPAPITREKLEAMGFVGHAHDEFWTMFRHPSCQGFRIRINADAAFMHSEIQVYSMDGPEDWRYATPQPQTLGDLAHLVWRLTRKDSPQ